MIRVFKTPSLQGEVPFKRDDKAVKEKNVEKVCLN